MRAAFVLSLVLLGATAAASSADPLKIRVGYQATPEKFAPFLAHRQDIVPHLGKSYELEALSFQASTIEITALAAGDVDFALLGYSSFGIAVDAAKMEDVRLVFDNFRDGVDGWYSFNFDVLKDSPVRTVEDLKGKVLATNGGGSVSDIAMRYVLKKHGLEDKRDYTSVEVSLANMVPMLTSRKVDLGALNTNFVHDPEIAAQLRPLFLEKDAFGVTEFAFYCARSEYLEKNRAALADFFEDIVRAGRWLHTPANRPDAIAMVSKIIKLSPDIMARYYLLPGADDYRDPNSRPDVAALQRNLDAMQELGYIKSHIDAAKYADLSLLDAAIARVDKAGVGK
ncbi:MAG TPA: ABC transporter substrate-binding protein [Stellaceae bacterium]|nr:ABC transporter substrate-binding protein [Stellaceae bacterium]